MLVTLLVTLGLLYTGTFGDHTTKNGDTIVGKCDTEDPYSSQVHCISSDWDYRQKGSLTMVEDTNSTTLSCKKSSLHSRLEDIAFPRFLNPARLTRISFSDCSFPNTTYAEVLKKLNVDINSTKSLELQNLPFKPPLKEYFFKGLNITSLKLFYKEETTVKSHLPYDVTKFVSTLKELHLVGAELPPLPNDTTLEVMTLTSGKSRGALGGCNHLRKLTLVNWDVLVLNMEDGWLTSCPKFTDLVLHSVSRDTLYRVLTNASSLLTLDIAKLPSDIPRIELSITNSLYMHTFRIRKTEIYGISLLSGYPSLLDVDVSENDLSHGHGLREFMIHAVLIKNFTASYNRKLDFCPGPEYKKTHIWMPDLERLLIDHTATSKICFDDFQDYSLKLIDVSWCNVTKVDFDGLPKFNKSQLVLKLNHNPIDQLAFDDEDYNSYLKYPLEWQPGIMGLKELHVRGNRIQNFTANSMPDTLKFLDLSNNRISFIDNTTATALFLAPDRRVRLSGNSIVCDCKNQPFLMIMNESRHQVIDFDKLLCAEDQTPIKDVAIATLCDEPEFKQSALVTILLPVILAIIFFVILTSAFYFRYGQNMKIYLYARGLCLCCLKEKDLDKNRPFDVFVSFSHDDVEYVVNELIPRLEQDGYKTCVHMRDWIVGEWIPKQIAASIDLSRRTLVVLSEAFVESQWGMLEFRMAHARALSEGRARLLLLLLGDKMPEVSDPELHGYLRTNTYLSAQDPRFWDKLRFALPRYERPAHPPRETNMADDVPSDFGQYGGVRPTADIQQRMIEFVRS